MMRTLLLSMLAAGLVSGAACAAPLEGLRWSKRVLLVFSAGTDADAEQAKAIAAVPESEFAARDLLVLDVPPRGTVRDRFGRGGVPLDAAALRDAYGISADGPFTTILVGKDGGPKWRETRPAEMAEIFRLIDSMPMRAEEMRRSRQHPPEGHDG